MRSTLQDRLWSVILAAGDGERLRPLTERWLGRHVPKQFCTFVGTRSMFQHTLDRAAKLSLPDRIATVIARTHVQEALPQLNGAHLGMLLLQQPENRGTVAGVFLPLTFIRAHDAQATVAILPSDHFVYPEVRFLEVLDRARWAAEWLADRLVLVGVHPSHAESDYGWIQPSKTLAMVCMSSGLTRVREVDLFLEKPTSQQAECVMARGGLWNTMALVTKAETLWKLGWDCFPEMMTLFERLARTIGTSEESHVLDDIYHAMPTLDLSVDLLQRMPDRCVVIELAHALWSDWGREERIVDTLGKVGKVPRFPSHQLVPV